MFRAVGNLLRIFPHWPIAVKWLISTSSWDNIIGPTLVYTEYSESKWLKKVSQIMAYFEPPKMAYFVRKIGLFCLIQMAYFLPKMAYSPKQATLQNEPRDTTKISQFQTQNKPFISYSGGGPGGPPFSRLVIQSPLESPQAARPSTSS